MDTLERNSRNSAKHQVPKYIDALKKLSPREVEVLELVAKGHTRKEIAKKLSISHLTVKRHKENIAEKLNLSGYHSLVKWYAEHSDALSGPIQ